MSTIVKDKKKALKPEDPRQLETFIGQLKKAEVSPFKDKIERAREDLRRSGLIK